MQNTTHAVMAQRKEPKDSRDDFPTPPWATRALLEYVVPEASNSESCLEPACGAGHMAKVLGSYFSNVAAQDKYDYGYGRVADFLETDFSNERFDWVITNPPFNLAEKFALKGLDVCREGVALLTRTVFIESVGRYNRLFTQHPPSVFAQFVERVPMVRGRLDAKATTATGYCWLVWKKKEVSAPRLIWVPPCRRSLEREGDYGTPSSIKNEEVDPSGDLFLERALVV